MNQESSNNKNLFRNTLNLPQTEFPIRANYKVADAELLVRWKSEDIYSKTFNIHKGSKKYILHDGPPYANGNIHLGHAYNKILKDIVTKGRRMFGYNVPVTPGWDCHGLPIELKVSRENPGLDRVALKAKCREYAQTWINTQREEFKQLGVFMDWGRPYVTMAPHYESKILSALSSFVDQGYVERKNKTVPWCANCQTVLAQAEIEHKERKDPSIYVLFDLKPEDSQKSIGHKNASLVVWTTTPWTLPLNQAVLVKPEADYSVIEYKDKYLLVGAQVSNTVLNILTEQDPENKAKVVGQIKAEGLAGIKVKHPILDKYVPLIFDESVGLEEGTAFVHCAPGCGPIDYEIGVKNNLSIFSPITPDGRYTSEIEIPELVNMSVSEGQIWVIKKLFEKNNLLIKKNISHSYPHCWRCYNGLIFRATPQWFVDLQRPANSQNLQDSNSPKDLKYLGNSNIKQRAIAAIEKIKFIPDQGRNFLRATIENRLEWCISRQRIWGVPIPAIICQDCDTAYIDSNLINKVAAQVERLGIEYWDDVLVSDLIDTNKACSKCSGKKFRKETDILDVWFDSGVSHYAVLYNNPELAFPADIYLEGVDQHRGWFQSSLLTSLIIEKEACTKSIVTHGYTVDAKGQKMSKSKGNVVTPQEIIDKLGTDGLRLWTSSIDFSSDPIISDILLNNVAEVGRKIRNTCRFLLSNLYDFSEPIAVSADKLMPIDYYALVKLTDLNARILNYYLENDFTAIFHDLADYCTVELSSFYLDIVKDRLYTAAPIGLERRSAQTALYMILDTLTKLVAPIMSFTSELLSDFYQDNKKNSIHLQLFNNPELLSELCFGNLRSSFDFITKITKTSSPESLINSANKLNNILENKNLNNILDAWQEVKEIRSALLKLIELEREKGIIKHSLEARVTINIDNNFSGFTKLEELYNLIKSNSKSNSGPNSALTKQEFWREILIVSQVVISETKDNLSKTELAGVYGSVEQAHGEKCPRCWQWDTNKNEHNLCKRCELLALKLEK